MSEKPREDEYVGRGWRPDSVKKSISPYYKAADDLAGHYNARCNSLMGEILTTLEATVDDERKLEALKTRVRDIQNLTWEEMNQEFWGNVNWFKKGSRSPTDFESLTNKTIRGNLTNYGNILQILIKAVFVDSQRSYALNKEMSRLIHKTRVSIHKHWSRIIAETFPETTKKVDEDAAEDEEKKK